MRVTLKEIKRFLTDNAKFIVIGTITFSVIIVTLMTYLDISRDVENNNKNENEDDIMLESSSAYFQFYAEYDEGDQFTNVGLIRQFLNLDDVKNSISTKTNIDIKEIEKNYNSEFKEFDDEFTVMNISRNSNNNVFTVMINTGNEDDNLLLAEHYYDLLMNNEFDFLYNKIFFTFVEPRMITDDMVEEVSEDESSVSITPRMLITNTAIGLIVGVVVLVGLALLKEIFGQKINYSFAYNVREDDKTLLFDPEHNDQGLLNTFVNLPIDENKIILIEQYDQGKSVNDSVDKLLLDINFEKTKVVNSLSSLPSNYQISEIIIIIVPYMTSRKWYNNQLEISGLYRTPTKIVQVNN